MILHGAFDQVEIQITKHEGVAVNWLFGDGSNIIFVRYMTIFVSSLLRVQMAQANEQVN